MSKKNKNTNEKELISIALTIIYKATNESAESCTFCTLEDQKVRLTYKDKSFMDFELNDKIDEDQKSILTRYIDMVRM